MTDQTTQLLTLEQVVNRTTLSKFTIYQMIKLELFPKQIQVGRNRVAWIEEEIRQWIEQKISDRGTST